MKSQLLGLRVAAAVFGLLSLAHLVRLVIRPEILVAGYVLPWWPSLPAMILLGGLSVWLWSLARIRPGIAG